MAALCHRLVRSAFVSQRSRVASTKFHQIRAMASGEKGNFVLEYKYVSDILEKRGPHREGHLGNIKAAIAEDKIIVGGAVGDPVDGAVLVFSNVTQGEIDDFVKGDPYDQNGLIASYKIKKFLRVQ